MSCRQRPQGGVGFVVKFALRAFGPPTMAIRRILPSAPRDEAAWSAPISAHAVSPYDAFSMFAAENIWPFHSSTAAPTANREYGAYARVATTFARLTSLDGGFGAAGADFFFDVFFGIGDVRYSVVKETGRYIDSLPDKFTDKFRHCNQGDPPR